MYKIENANHKNTLETLKKSGKIDLVDRAFEREMILQSTVYGRKFHAFIIRSLKKSPGFFPISHE